MKLFKHTTCLVLLLTSLITACFAQKYPYQDPSQPIEKRVNDLLSRMTTLEKIRQLDMYRGWSISTMGEAHEATSVDADSLKKVFKTGAIGSIHDFYPVSAALANKVQRFAMENTRLEIPVMFIEEGLHGYSGKGSTSFPIPLALGASWDTSLIYHVGRAIGTESRAHGTDMILGPLLGIARDPRWGRMEETFGEDTYLVSEIGLAMVKGLQGGDVSRPDAVVSEPKHFAVHPAPEAGSNTGPVNMGERTIRTDYLPTFRKAVEQGGALGIMAAYHEIDGIPCVDNHWLLTDILRKDWGFKGMVLSDLGAIKMSLVDHHVAGNRADALAQTINAGLNMQFYDFDHKDFEKSLDSALANNLISKGRLDSTTGDVLRVKFLLGLFDHPYTDTNLMLNVLHNQRHQRLALQAAGESVVLLKNDHHTLPIKRVSGKTIKLALIGPLAKSNYLGGYANTSDTAISLYTGLQMRAVDGLDVQYAPGMGNKKEIKSEIRGTQSRFVPDVKADRQALAFAVNLAQASDMAVVTLGEDPDEVGEGKDRADLMLSERQQRLIEAVVRTGKPVVVVLFNGRPLCINWVSEHAAAILEGWFGGEKSGLALADILLGNMNPSGKLPVTFPRSVGQIPFYYAHKPTSFHRYVDEKPTPLYPFGHGLSYTSFKYSDLELPQKSLDSAGSLEVRLQVTNTGSVTGTEVVQLYIRDEVASVTTPVKALKSFSKVTLAPGASKQIIFKLPVGTALGLWNRDMQYVVEPGSFDVMVGSSAEDIRLKGQIEIK